MSSKPKYSVLLDTSFLIRLLSGEDPLHRNALGYYKYFLDNEVEMKISTISIAEYCAKGEVSELPLVSLKIVPFNFHHATQAGLIAKGLFAARNAGKLPAIDNRLIIPNDSKLFAQANMDVEIKYFVTSDAKAKQVIEAISQTSRITFQHLDIATSHKQMFGELF